jgi:hypothetical protein
VNIDEAKSRLLRYRPGTADDEDPQMAEALALAKSSPELAGWLEAQVARQNALRAKFQQIAPPAGLKEQIIAEHAASVRAISPRKAMGPALAFLLLVLLGTMAVIWYQRGPRESDNALGIYQNEMVRVALGGYAMDLVTNDTAAIRSYLAQNRAPANFTLPAKLQQATLLGCAVESWQGACVSLVCYRSGRPLPPGQMNDLWLFVADRKTVKNAPDTIAAQLARVNRLITATWTEGDQLYFLAEDGGEADLKRYL